MKANKKRGIPLFNSPINNYVILFSSAFIGLITLFAIILSFLIPLQGADSPHCKGVYMSPAYAKVYAFDSTHTRFASKYSLYLYREQGKDIMPQNDSDEFILSGTPVLFIPGNARSYKQVRSLAAEAANQYYKDWELTKSLNPNVNSLDFFTADFNEDFTAFHGRTMLDQSEYLNEAVKFILSLYKGNPNIKTYPTSVILIGHSMGGMVARVMLSLPNYKEDSVNTIITLSTPHNTAPTTFDGDLLNVYKLTDDFWRNGFVSSNLENNSKVSEKLTKVSSRRLKNVSLLSITGGTLDTTLPTDYTTLTGLIPKEHGLFVSTTGIPEVWTPIDHLAIVWCDQLRKVLVKTLLQMIDVNSPLQTYPLEKRMQIMENNLNSGFDKATDLLSKQDSPSLPIKLKIDLKQLKDSPNERFFQLPKSLLKRNAINSPPIHLFNIPKGESFKFNFISTLKPIDIQLLNKSPAPSLLLCKSIINSFSSSKSKTYEDIFDYKTEGTNKYAELECTNINNLTYIVPRSYHESKNVLHALELSSKALSSFDSVVLVESAIELDIKKDFVLADLELEQSSNVHIGDQSLWNLMTKNNEVALPAHRPIIVDIDIPAMKSSLLAYKIDVRFKKSNTEKFTPIISQTFKGETKWHLEFDENKPIIAVMNANSPYTPFIVNDPSNHGKFKLFSDSSSSEHLTDIYVSIDWFQSLKLMVLKYRLSIIGFPLFISLAIMVYQFIQYGKTGFYPSYGEGFAALMDYKIFGIVVLIFSFLSLLTSPESPFGKLLEILDPVGRNELKLMSQVEKAKVEVNLMFMSISESALWFYGTFMLFISLGLNFLLYNIVLLFLKVLIIISKHDIWKKIKVPAFDSLSTERKTISIITLLLLVLLYLPYQFAFVVCTLTQIFSTSYAFMKNDSLNAYSTSFISREEKKNDSLKKSNVIENYKNFNLSFTLLMLWLVPISVPVLIVWIHDISLKWRTPFSSHHNILAILPIILLIQIMNQGYMIPRPRGRANLFITKFVLIYFAIYSIIFGTRHLYFLHSFFNALCAWLLILLVQEWGSGNLEKNNINFSKHCSKLQ
ncbi:hypothetical protein CANINC_001278 [Pichia inconspicua]|uniref:GPI inositol-deacylase n=1 Tax=Pichia inconspicua TaxID=52247 RepID=A0A4T0X3Y8_9ASCO|nr:hypothetical protein CANINC_001278 [[Candida] inconspicua]